MTHDDRACGFASAVAVVGEWRTPVQLLAHQQLTSGPTIHDAEVAAELGMAGSPIEGPTHFSQVDPLAATRWGRRWFEHGGLSVRYRTPAFEGQEIQAELSGTLGADRADVTLRLKSGDTVLAGIAFVGTLPEPTPCAQRLASSVRPARLRVIDEAFTEFAGPPRQVRMTGDDPLGRLYPFTLRQKLAAITEPCSWYDGEDNPWGRPIVPIELLSPLLHAGTADDPRATRRDAVGLFMDQEIRLHGAPIFVDHVYAVRHRIVGVGGSPRTESYWVETVAREPGTGELRASMLLHIGFMLTADERSGE